MVFHFLVSAYFQTIFRFCSQCDGDRFPNQIPGPGGDPVKAEDFQTLYQRLESADPNCEYYRTDFTQANCQLCKDDQSSERYILNHNNECVPRKGRNALRFGCTRMDADFKCTACRPGWLHLSPPSDQDDKLCYYEEQVQGDFFCSKFDQATGECEICRQGYVHDTVNQYKCVEHTSGDCDRLNIDGTCMSCVAKNSYPVNYKINGATANPYFKYICAEQENDSMENFEFGFQHFDFADNTLKNYDTLPDDELLWTTSTSADILAASGSKVKHKCVDVFGGVFENCVKADTNGFECTKCAEGYTFASNPNDFNTCTKVVVAERDSPCYKFYPGSVECEICAADQKMDSTTGLCVPRTFTSGEYVLDSACVGNNADNSECEFCPEGNQSIPITYYKVAGGVSAANCLQLNAAGTECAICEPGFEYSGTGLDCTAADPTTDSCSVLEYPYPGGPALFGSANCLICLPHQELSSNQCAEPAGAGVNSRLDIDSSGVHSLNPRSYAKKIETAPNKGKAECVKPYGSNSITLHSFCLIYAKSGDCHMCEYHRDGTNCSNPLSNSNFFYILNDGLEPTGQYYNFLPDYVNLAMQIFISTGRPVHCPHEKNMTIIYMETHLQRRSSYRPRKPTMANDFDKTGVEFTRSYPVVLCVEYSSGNSKLLAASTTDFGIASRVKFESGTQTVFADSDCVLWKDTTNNVYNCARCADNYVPIIKKANGSVKYNTGSTADEFDSSTTLDQTQGAFIDSCVAADPASVGTFERLYEGLSYTNL